MFVKNELGEYEAKIERLLFVCDEVKDGYEMLAGNLARAYRVRLEAIGKFLLEEGIGEIFGEMHTAKIVRSLGKPVVNLDKYTLTYADHLFDDYSIITIEFGGLFEEFFSFCVDG